MIVVEALSRGAKGPIDADVDVAVCSKFECKLTQSRGPVAFIGLDVNLQSVLDAGRDGEGVELEPGQSRNLQEDVLTGIVSPVLALGMLGRHADRLIIEHLESRRNGSHAAVEAVQALKQDDDGGEDEPVAEHRSLQQFGSPVGTARKPIMGNMSSRCPIWNTSKFHRRTAGAERSAMSQKIPNATRPLHPGSVATYSRYERKKGLPAARTSAS